MGSPQRAAFSHLLSLLMLLFEAAENEIFGSKITQVLVILSSKLYD